MSHDPAQILDRCLKEARAGRDPEAILRRHPELADEVRPLLGLAGELGDLPDPTPSVAGVMRLLAKASAEPVETTQPKPRIRLFSRPVLTRAAAILICVLLVGWGTTAASYGTVPGDWLYPVKLLTEKVQFWLTLNAEGQTELRIRFSEQRLKELVKKHRRGAGLDRVLLRAMLDEADQALADGPDLPHESRALYLARVAHLADLQKKTLEGLVPGAAPAERETLAAYIRMCDHRCDCARRLVPESGLPASQPDAAQGHQCPGCR